MLAFNCNLLKHYVGTYDDDLNQLKVPTPVHANVVLVFFFVSHTLNIAFLLFLAI